MSLFVLSACSNATKIEQVETLQVKTIEISKPAPIVPAVDQLKLRPISWVIITPENINDRINELKLSDGVFFALTAKGYEDLSLNLSDVRANIEQYKRVIAVYKSQY